jgi:glycosyltransferase involved in cell wall biosynthesis
MNQGTSPRQSTQGFCVGSRGTTLLACSHTRGVGRAHRSGAQDMKVSVVVPVYQVPAEMLRVCVDSLLRQTLAEIEFIFVVDGEDDPSLPILTSIAAKDSRIRVLSNPVNRGVSFARNRGLDVARGHWIGFVDADDWIEPTMYARLHALAEDGQCDLFGCRLTFSEEGRGKVLPVRMFAGISDMANDAAAARAYMKAGLSCCTKLFSRKRFGALRFPEEFSNLEDGIFLHRAFQSAVRVGFVDEALYHTCHRPDSAQHRPMDIIRFSSCYRALGVLAQIATERAEGMSHVRKTSAWQLLTLSIGTRSFHEELLPEARGEAWRIIRTFTNESLGAFRAVYPPWLRQMLAWKLRDPNRLFNRSNLFYSLLWQQIRLGTAQVRGETPGQLARDLGSRLVAKLRP